MQQVRPSEMLGSGDFVPMHSKIIGTNVDRTKGLTVHLLPRGVANPSEKKGGFAVLYRRKCPIFETAAELIRYFKTLSTDTEKNGIWVVTAHSDSYSRDDFELLDQLKLISIKQNISLFISRPPSPYKAW